MCVCGGPWIKGYQQGAIPHHWWMANEEASDESCKRTCDLPPSDMARWLSYKPPMQTWHANMITWHYIHDFISSHFTLSLRGVSKCVFSCTRISDKVPGKLGGASTGDTRLLQNLPDMMLPEAKFAQASKFRTSIQNSPSEAEFLRIRQVACSEFASIQIFHPSAFPVPSHDSCSPSDPVKTKHWEKQHHAVTSLFLSVVGCLLNSRKFWCSGLLLSAFFSGNWLERLEASLVFVGDSKTPHLIGDTHDPCTQRFEHHVCHNPALRETAPCRYQPFLSVVGCLLNSRKFWCSGLLLSAFSVELALNAVKLPLVLCWSKQHKVTDIWAPCSMSQHNTVENSTLD